jgi:hypothetical protein
MPMLLGTDFLNLRVRSGSIYNPRWFCVALHHPFYQGVVGIMH